jgi:hypothetical protein
VIAGVRSDDIVARSRSDQERGGRLSDDERELERRFRATGADDDGVRWLTARLRSGKITERGIALAGYLGHSAAKRLAGDWPPAVALAAKVLDYPHKQRGKFDMTPPRALERFVAGLHAWDEEEALLRAVFRAAEILYPPWEEFCSEQPMPYLALEAARDYIICPCREHAKAADEPSRETRFLIGDPCDPNGYGVTGIVHKPEARASGAFSAGWAAGVAAGVAANIQHGVSEIARVLLWAELAARERDFQSEEALLRNNALRPNKGPAHYEIIDTLLPWALGLGDPIREAHSG